jgi:hypothetical protein
MGFPFSSPLLSQATIVKKGEESCVHPFKIKKKKTKTNKHHPNPNPPPLSPSQARHPIYNKLLYT